MVLMKEDISPLRAPTEIFPISLGWYLRRGKGADHDVPAFRCQKGSIVRVLFFAGRGMRFGMTCNLPKTSCEDDAIVVRPRW